MRRTAAQLHREKEQFYRTLKEPSVRVGMEASGHSRWFEHLLTDLQFELWIGDAAEIRTKRVRKQKTDRQDAQLLLRLMIEDRFPRIWVPDAENRDLRQLLWHRHRLCRCARAGDEPVACDSAQRRLASQEGVVASRRPPGTGVDRIGALGHAPTPGLASITRSTHAQDPRTDAGAGRGNGEASGDAAVGDASRRGSADGVSVRVSDWNSRTLSLRETDCQLCGTGSIGELSGDRRRLGHISKQGNALLRFLLVEAAQVTVRSQPDWRSTFFHLAMRRGRKIAKVAMARKLAVHLYWMWRQGCDYGQLQKLGSHAGEPGNPYGVQ